MAARNRPRGGLVKEDPADAHEERNMWNQIVSDLKRLKGIHARAAEVSAAIVDMESRFDGCMCTQRTTLVIYPSRSNLL